MSRPRQVDVRGQVAAVEADPFALIDMGLIWVRSKGGELVRFVPNAPQAKLLADIRAAWRAGRPFRAVILKARQMGFSTLVEAVNLCLTIHYPHANALIIADTHERTGNVYAMVSLMHELLQESAPWLAPTRQRSNAKEIVFDRLRGRRHGGQIRVATATSGRQAQGQTKTSGVGKSFTFRFLHYTEAGSFPDMDAVIGGANASVVPPPHFSLIVYESTADAYGGQFWDLCRKARTGETGERFYFFPWFELPDYAMPLDAGEILCLDGHQPVEGIRAALGLDSPGLSSSSGPASRPVDLDETTLVQVHGCTPEQIKWRRWAIANLCQGDVDHFRREFPATPDEAFLQAGRPRFDVIALRDWHRRNIREPEATGSLSWRGGLVELVPGESHLWVWGRPDPRASYVIGVDLAEGLEGGDANAAVVLDRGTGEVVATLHNRLDPDQFGQQVALLGYWYHQALVCSEVNGPGLAFLATLRRGDPAQGLPPYPAIYSREEEPDQQLDPRLARLGWRTNPRTKALMIDELAQALRDKTIRFHDRRLLEELLAYQRLADGKMGAPAGGHDDWVMALAIALQGAKQSKGFFQGLTVEALTRRAA